ncbi:MAG: TetR/AcrR family transcriptional regulator [Planctomycetaceae bacterium]|nr:TetR/AcrR family transcriptional regulator [Planctomycetaceae bacterium]
METISRKEREKIRHRTEILAKALDLFSEKGFHNVSMQDIAVRSEYAVGTLYNFFQSKEQLFDELRNDCVERILQSLMPILESDTPENEKIHVYIVSHIDLMEENLKFIRLYVAQHGTLTPSNNEKEGKAYEVKTVLRNKLVEVINAGIAKKFFKPVDTNIYVLSLEASLQTYIMESSVNYNKANVQDGLAKIENLFCGMLIN